MKSEEIWAKLPPPSKCSSQIEFDELMHNVNNEQSKYNHPYLDRLREINKQKTLIAVQIQALHQQLSALKVEQLEIEQKKKDANRVFHEWKHQLIELNPKGLKNEQAAT